ncbi:hypothetical protein COCSUDRAFT_58225 [Coccomyxa subellipsoidea C-169]|uniref:Uncharacterized protein n=1 Tax=Coccomyxa subellipsoidea (strain C-169) TaxID=574566 RepID=I0YNM2_COCSC|nr:hypothetical protein COCSUDRAFT_58225 [Coccomyxa subellipsoidea C-169]EIE19991.1 hypothetical protein COCSUDRAFT_58225 [Coccomyxa subellipsoidea C-169]|eukprot:XP_005644535.1 hypothetical protein COCSUDRAFT_58225 [Coccomyxa subellipsoidea C-169]
MTGVLTRQERISLCVGFFGFTTTVMYFIKTNQNYWSRLSDVEQRLAELERRAGLAPLVEDDGGDSDDEMDDSDESDAEPEENMAAADDSDDADDPGVMNRSKLEQTEPHL